MAPVGTKIVISFYNKVAKDWKQDGSYIQMRLPDPHSAVISQQQLDRVTGTVQRMMEVELEPTEMWLALCEINIECYDIVSYNPSPSPAGTDDTTEDEERDEGYDEENIGEDEIANLRVLCFYHPWDCLFHPRHVTRPYESLHSYSAAWAALLTNHCR